MRSWCRTLGVTWLILAAAAAAWGDGKAVVSIEARDRNIRDVIRTLAETAGVQVHLRPEVRGVISTTIAKTPFEQALTVVAATQGYSWRLVKGVYHVGRFSDTPDDPKPIKAVVPVVGFRPRELARAFGWLDLAALDDAVSVVDLRALLPPGLDGPPQPVDGGLQVSGAASAVADFKYLLSQLAEGRALLTFDVMVCEVTPEALSKLPVYWAKSTLNAARSPGREAQLSTGDLSALAKLLARPPAGIRLVGKGRLTTSSLSTAQWNFGDDQQGGVELRLASRVEPSLGLKLWLQARVKLGKGAAPVELQIDGAPIPPEEAVVAASKAPKDGQAAPAPVLILVVPTVEVTEPNGKD